MFAEHPRASAEDAWMLTALDMEHARSSGQHTIGGALDLYKALDQFLRPLLYSVLALSGFPPSILAAYINFQENMLIHNLVLGTIGSAHRHPCGIPQGCPFSMLFTALLLRPWMSQMYSYQAIPRTLADDLLLFCTGHRSLRVFAFLYDLSITHLREMGGRISAQKCKVFSTSPSFRQWLKRYKWPTIGDSVKVVTSLRDLGAHLATTRTSTTQSAERLRKAIATLTRIGWLPHDSSFKNKLHIFIDTSVS